MTETGFDWRRLTEPAPEVHGASQRAVVPPTLGRWLAVGAVVAAIALAGIVLAMSAPQPAVVIDGASPEPQASGVANAVLPGPSASLAALTVDVDGAVIRPGLVTLPAGSRIGDAVAAAGGFAPAADARAAAALNLAAPLADGDQISIPDRIAAAAGGSDGPASTGSSSGSGPTTGAGGSGGPIDLDQATLAELDTLPGIGPVTADKILAARDEAPFVSVDDLLTRKLVGPATFEKIKGLVTADGR
ncbi:MAG TPA: helix-hairpin-helix domain-containing protein [Candidatus Limnocylindrales bacterium]|jgi:competence protein ComEA